MTEETGGGIMGGVQEKRLGSRSPLMMMAVAAVVVVYVCVLVE